MFVAIWAVATSFFAWQHEHVFGSVMLVLTGALCCGFYHDPWWEQ
jgi:hypothetical protein